MSAQENWMFIVEERLNKALQDYSSQWPGLIDRQYTLESEVLLQFDFRCFRQDHTDTKSWWLNYLQQQKTWRIWHILIHFTCILRSLLSKNTLVCSLRSHDGLGGRSVDANAMAMWGELRLKIWEKGVEKVHSLKLTAKAPENRPFCPKKETN